MSSNILGTVQSSNGTGNSSTVLLPSGMAVGEKLTIAFVKVANGVIATPAGFNLVDNILNGSVVQISVYERTIDGTEGASVVITDTKYNRWVALAFRSDAASIGAFSFGVASSTTLNCPSINTANDNTTLLRLVGIDAESVVSTESDVTKPALPLVGEKLSTVGSGEAYIGIVREDQATAGASGVQAFSTATAVDAVTATIALISPAASGEITDVDTDEIIVDGQSSVSVTVSGFSGDISSFKLSDGTHETENLVQAGSGDNYTVDFPDISGFTADTVGPPIGEPSYLIASDGTDTDAIEIQIEPKTGWAVLPSVSMIAGFGSVSDTAYSDGSKIYYDTQGGAVTVFQNGTYLTTGAVTQFNAVIRDIDTGIWIPSTVILQSTGNTSVAAYLTAINIGPADTQLFTLNTKTNPDQWEGEGGSPILPKP